VAIDELLLSILVCPETREKVAPADADTLAKLNALVDKGTLVNRKGQHVTERLDAALQRADGAVCYAVRGDIPIMLVDEAIPLDQLPAT
jgi:uncharacterized protein YbaR (Trm112 family)